MSIALTKKHGYTIQVEFTFKTNKYGSPLLHFVSWTGTDNSLTLAFAFLASRTEEDVVWAMFKLKEVMCDIPTTTIVTDE